MPLPPIQRLEMLQYNESLLVKGSSVVKVEKIAEAIKAIQVLFGGLEQLPETDKVECYWNSNFHTNC